VIIFALKRTIKHYIRLLILGLGTRSCNFKSVSSSFKTRRCKHYSFSEDIYRAKEVNYLPFSCWCVLMCWCVNKTIWLKTSSSEYFLIFPRQSKHSSTTVNWVTAATLRHNSFLKNSWRTYSFVLILTDFEESKFQIYSLFYFFFRFKIYAKEKCILKIMYATLFQFNPFWAKESRKAVSFEQIWLCWVFSKQPWKKL